MKEKINYLIPVLLGITPVVGLARTEDLPGLITKVKEILVAVIPVIVSLAVIYFIWTTSQYILKEGEAKNEARSHMIWGIVILFVMVSVWGLVDILVKSFL